MTGIERLRKLSEDMLNLSLWVRLTTGTEKDWDCYQGDGRTINDELLSIANQIEQEARAPFSRVRVLAVISDMESRVSDEGGSFGALVARWARELRGAVCSGERDPAEDVSVSAYDLLPADEREAIAWVREHGGLDHVRAEWDRRSNLKRTCEKLRAKVERQQSHIELVQGKCKTRVHRIVELHKTIADMRPRLMPEGMEWPTVDGEPAVIGERMRSCGIEDCKVVGIDPVNARLFLAFDDIKQEKAVYFPDSAKYCHRPAPKVLDADGEPLEVGQTVWDTNGDELVIGALEDGGHTVTCRYADVGDGIPTHGMWSPSDLTHQRPVLDADGVPIKKGDTVWNVGTVLATPMTVVEVSCDTVRCEYAWTDGKVYRPCCSPDTLTHAKPEIDSWQRIEEDVMVDAKDYCESRGISSEYPKHSGKAKCEDIVRRCRALAERERGE